MKFIKRGGLCWMALLLFLAFMLFQPYAEASILGGSLDLTNQSAQGKSVNEAVSQLTGTAVNPLLGVTALGMYRYFTTPVDLRDQLPFYNQPYVWGIMLLVILLMLFNSTISESMPFLKIPLNALGDLVNKGGACIVLPIVLYEFAQVLAATTADALVAASNMAFPTAYAAENVSVSVGDGWLLLGWAVSWIFGAIAYATVWVVWNVIDVTILVLPVPFLDAILKSIRLGAMTLVYGAATVHPLLGLLVSLMMLFLCWRLSGWAFRLSVMGFIFSTDFLLWRKSGIIDATVGIPAFVTAAAGKRWKLPTRQYGRLRHGTEGTLYFVWRSWLIGPERETLLGKPSDYQCGSALLYPMVLEETDETVLFRLPPRYRRYSQMVTEVLKLNGWRDVSVVRNLWKLLREFFRSRQIT